VKKVLEKLKKMSSLRILIYIGVALIIVGGSSFAYINFFIEGNETNLVKAGCFKTSFTENNVISLKEQAPMSDTNGKTLTPYTFTITNTCEIDASFEATFNTLTTSTLENESKVKVYLTGDKTIEPIIVEDLTKVDLLEGSSGVQNSYLIDTGVLKQNESKTYNLRMWIDYDVTSFTGTFASKVFISAVSAGGSSGPIIVDPSISVVLDSSGANAPVLASNMIPVIYDSGNSTWVKADKYNSNLSWFNYTDKKWANAVTVTEANRDTYLKATAGTPIAMSDINTMWVWIPRFSATGDIANYNGGTASAPGAFNITFVDTETTAHDAFDFGGAVSGFWMGKFETTGSVSNACTSSSCNVSNVTILPNKLSLVSQTVSSFFYMSRSMETSGNAYGFDKTKDTTLDIHMLKNNEWGAVAYLTQSIYGRCTSSTSCTEIGINNNLSFVTGYGAPAGSEDIVSNGTYETELGMDASTTGNIYGVYDMSGGVYEYVMGLYWDGTKLWSGYNLYNNSGFNGWLEEDAKEYTNGVSYPSDSKYYNTYTNTGTEEAPVTNYTSMQHALTETSGWYGDGAQFVSASYPWVNRGGNYNCEDSAGIFTFYNNWGVSDFEQGVRSSLKVD